MKRALVLLFIGLGIVGISKLAAARGASSRLKEVREEVDAECRAFRAKPEHRHADICRYDHFSPKALPMYRDAKEHLDHARHDLGRGDLHAAESNAGRAVSFLDPLAEPGTPMAYLVRAALVKDVLDLAKDYPELDAMRLLRGVHLETTEAFTAESLQLRWSYAHWEEIPDTTGTTMSESERVEAIEATATTYRTMSQAMLRKDVMACEEAGRTASIAALLCQKLPPIMETSARLEALQAGRLSSRRR